jgi:ABC-type multidrug transport system fused ATPase/permease subunit
MISLNALGLDLIRDPNMKGLCISWMSNINEILGFLFYNLLEFNAGVSCVERIVDMSVPAKEEPAYDFPAPPCEDWPTRGTIEMKAVSMRYRGGLPLVLRRVDLSVCDKEKLGIVGRTGSGKSSMILTLKRMIDIEADAGSSITVDGVSIDQIGLKFYRAAVALIPQDPFLLSGTVRSNVDPFCRHTDEEIEWVLTKINMFHSLQSGVNRVGGGEDPNETQQSAEKEGSFAREEQSQLLRKRAARDEVLNYEVKEGGSNLSQGQRQLLCIARAIICRPKILLMDEATANIDSKTDQTIQKIIKNEFKDSTVITIAHRLNTIIQYDRVVVMANGEIVDQGSPAGLLEKEGIFRELVMELGENNFNKMKQFANDLTLDPILD